MKRGCVLVLALFFVPSVGIAQSKPMQVTDLFKFQRVADPQLSPDGQWVAYQVGTVNLAENKSSTNLWVAATDGKTPPKRLTSSTKSDRRPRWSPDGKTILFESSRSGSVQLWSIDLTGGEAKQLTNISTGASSALWSPDGKKIAFVSAVFPEFSHKPFAEADAENKKKLDAIESSPVKAKVFSKLFYRHWDEYVEDKRQHLFVMDATGGTPLNVTPGDRDAFPTSSTFSAGDDYTFSPDGSHLVFTAVPERDEAWSTNYELCRVPVTGGKVETLTKANVAADNLPRFSPDGKKLAYRAQRRAGYEADKWELMLVDVAADGAFRGEPKSLTKDLDRSIDDFVWMDVEGKTTLLLLYEDNATTRMQHCMLEGKFLAPLPQTIQTRALNYAKGKLAYMGVSMQMPAEIFVNGQNISQANSALLKQLDLPKPESVSIDVVGGVKMQMWILKPPGFDANKKWPVAYLVHGGPQGAWEDGWSFRWNPQAWAAQGYVVVLPNPRGSTSFGQKFVDEISGDWGGKCYDDLMKGVDYVEKLPYVDKNRIAAAGASFGGYMMNWFAVNTTRFKTLITHCSVWNFDSMWGTTDELWFDEYEHGGLPWDKPESYAKFSPHRKAGNLGKYKTPMLIIHNDLDFRCPIGQGHELFSALQRQHVPSRFINFPDEGHWVLKPKNSEYWHNEVLGWLKKYCAPGGK